jgi:hypothetical protein
MFVCRLADEIDGIVMNQWLNIWYPESAKEIYVAHSPEISQRLRTSRANWRAEHGLVENRQPRSPIRIPKRQSAPCPYCGKPLRNSMAKQCLSCKMDWHDPNNVHCYARKLPSQSENAPGM